MAKVFGANWTREKFLLPKRGSCALTLLKKYEDSGHPGGCLHYRGQEMREVYCDVVRREVIL